ncbi:methyl-accepting chemotaxis protein [Acuticoccus sp. MNP-M23]|uniref:methyl-accepting chemotaxis protein n=1 Tax=Acuticoccus sp. MNP-M23 TaxID=3072793 RepID=UPI002814BBB0|nr:methyl-accepting chemotaxis protein [Acuticoccus sp. MNP-M23]WMS42474.1 methyl-accepting chemotaxis protein [Acuticoccus sp. MNP-M23]
MSTESTFGRAPNLLNNITTSTKIVASVLLIFMLFVLSQGLSYQRARNIADNFTKLEAAASENLHVIKLEERLAEAWAAILDYRVTPSNDRMQAVHEALREMERERAHVQRGVTSEAASPLLAEIAGLLDRFEINVARTLELQAQRSVLVTTLETTGNSLTAHLTEAIDTANAASNPEAMEAMRAVEALLLKSRLSVQRFLTAGTPASLTTARDYLSEAQALAPRMALLASQSGAAVSASTYQDGLENYRTKLDALGDISQEFKTTLGQETGAVKTEIIEKLDQVAELLLVEEAALNDATEGTIAGMVVFCIVVLVAGLLLLTAIGFIQIQTLSRPLRAVTAALDDLAQFKTRFAVREKNAKDELGRMWDSVAQLRPALAAVDTQTKMVNGMSLPVMLADPQNDFKITYMNDAAKSVLEKLRDHLPCGPDEMMGRSIDMFHENPERQRRILSDPSNLPWRGMIDFKGLEFFDLYVAPLFDRDGVYSGTVLSWRVVTAEMTRLNEIEDDVRRTVHDINETFSAMRSRIGNIGDGVQKTRTHLKSGSEAVFSASSSVQTVASAAEELSASISEISTQMTQSSRRSSEAASVAKDVASRAETLSAASRNISTVVETISEIANQVSLLALNATIEAARAGEAGKGFAVVATEVKNLAVQTGQATAKVSEQTSAIQEQIANVTEGITNVSRVIEEINEVFVSVAASAEEQQVATSEISRNAQIAAEGAENATTTIQEVENFSEANMAATQELSQSAEAVSSANDNLGRETDRFLEVLRRV